MARILYARVRLIPVWAKRKIIPSPCQIGDLNALNRPEVVIRYRLLPVAASWPASLISTKRSGGFVEIIAPSNNVRSVLLGIVASPMQCHDTFIHTDVYV